jgi:very-short-patch-repair endonuclease
MEKRGLKVLRIPNNQVKNNFEGICLYIDKAVKESN